MNIGDEVLIVRDATHIPEWVGSMNQYLGATLTIEAISAGWYKMVETRCSFTKEMIVGGVITNVVDGLPVEDTLLSVPQRSTPVNELPKEKKMAKFKVSKAKSSQIASAKITAKIEVGKVANAQITKLIMSKIELPAILVGFKKQLTPVIKLLVANGGIVAAESFGVNNDKADFILEAMQLAGTQELLGLVDINQVIDDLVGKIDPKLLAQAQDDVADDDAE